MNMNMKVRLSALMFLEFFIWGAWFVTMATYLFDGLGFEGASVGAAYSTTAWAAIIAPFFVGMIADKFFNAEKVLFVTHLLGAGVMWYASSVTDPTTFFWVLLAYAVCYMPTIALVNTVAFSQMENVEKEFPGIRVWGTIGWIVAGLFITFLLNGMVEGNVEATAIPMKMAAAASLILAIYSCTLPKTAPPKSGEQVTISDILGLDALKLMKNRSFAIFVISSLLICIPLSFYYALANPFLNSFEWGNVAAKMSLGQASEVLFMLVIPFFFARLGVKKMLLIGMLAWVGRYLLFAFGGTEMMGLTLYGGILLHGICYDFFFVTGMIYVDNKAPKEIRASAQGFIAMVTYGIGMVIGSNIAGQVSAKYTSESGAVDWQSIWLIPGAMAFVVVIGFALLFKEKESESVSSE
jgi:nucleoside transporter